MKRIAIAVCLAALALTAVVRLHADDKKANVLMEAGLAKETIQGDLQGAIAQYEKAVKEAGANRALAVIALMKMAESYQKLGNSQARKIYEQIVKDYADQKDAVTIARAGLGAMGATPGPGRQTFELISDDVDKVSHCGGNLPLSRPLLPCTDHTRTGDLWLRDIATGDIRYLIRNGPDPRGKASDAIISADGEKVIYSWDLPGSTSQAEEIRVINSDGTGMSTLLSRAPKTGIRGMALSAMSPDKKAAILRVDGILQILSLEDKSLRPFGDGSQIHGAPVFSPDGRQVVFSIANEITIANADGGNVRTLLPESSVIPGAGLVWSPDGKWIVFESFRSGIRAIWAIPANGGTPRVLKEGREVLDLLGITRDGSLYYTTSASENDIQIAQMNSEGSVTGAPSRLINTFLGRNITPSFSPDGNWIAWVSLRTPPGSGPAPTVVRPTAGGDERVLPEGTTTMWAPDGKGLLRRRVDSGELVVERVEVADGRITEIYRGTDFKVSSRVVLAGDALLGTRCPVTTSSTSTCGLVRYDLRTHSETVESLSGITDLRGGQMQISPDGKWLALIGVPKPGAEIRVFLKQIAGGKPVVLRDPFVAGFRNISWTPDSKQIVFSTRPDDQLRAVPIDGGESTTIPLKATYATISPGGKIAYTVEAVRDGLWVARNLLPPN